MARSTVLSCSIRARTRQRNTLQWSQVGPYEARTGALSARTLSAARRIVRTACGAAGRRRREYHGAPRGTGHCLQPAGQRRTRGCLPATSGAAREFGIDLLRRSLNEHSVSDTVGVGVSECRRKRGGAVGDDGRHVQDDINGDLLALITRATPLRFSARWRTRQALHLLVVSRILSLFFCCSRKCA